MKSFKQFCENKILSIKEPIHFKMSSASINEEADDHLLHSIKNLVSKHNSELEKEPTYFHHDKTNVPDNITGEHEHEIRNDDELEKIHYTNLSSRIHEKNFPEGIYDTDHEKHLKWYTGYNHDTDKSNSLSMNKKLIEDNGSDKRLTHQQLASHNTIKHLASPIGRELHVYSGTKTNFGELAKKSKDGILHSHAHLSVTHVPQAALNFAHDNLSLRPEEDRNMIHIHMKPKDKGVHVSKISEYPDEHETIIPSGTKLKYKNTTRHIVNKNKFTGTTTHINVHHFTIHSQE